MRLYKLGMIVGATAVLTTSLGCMLVGSSKWFEHRGNAKLAQRASFDLSCPEDELSFSPLDDYKTVGVIGCERRATYIYVSDSGTWVMNSETE